MKQVNSRRKYRAGHEELVDGIPLMPRNREKGRAK